MVKVLIVDDSALVRSMIKSGIERLGHVTVIGTASDPYEARDLISREVPDVITLDIEMPKMNGLDFLRYLMSQLPIPVIMVSSFSEEGKQITLDALSFGAIDFVTKPLASNTKALSEMIYDLHKKILMASRVKHSKITDLNLVRAGCAKSENIQFRTNALVAIGASTGGTEAIRDVVATLPGNFPPILVAQHMPKGFTSLFARRLNDVCNMRVKEAVDGELLENGTIYVAPGGAQMGWIDNGGRPSVSVKEMGLFNGHCPSVGYLFHSLKSHHDLTAVLLTGMGRDGSEEICSLRSGGGYTIAQDEESCVVYGMPGEAVKRGGICDVLPLNAIREKLIQKVRE